MTLWIKTFFSLLLQAFRTADLLKSHIKDCFKINGKQDIKIHQKSKYARFKMY